MILLAIALAVQTVAPQPSNEVVVTARRLKDWRGQASSNANGSRCRTTTSTGDKELDQVACDSMRWCMGSLQKEASALNEKGLSRAEREQRGTALNSSLTRCVEDQHQRRVADLLDRRAAARIEASAKN
jgi:hypothetical protein